MSDRNVLITGASVAGPMCAYWFARAGWNVTIIERFPELRPGGQNIDIRSTGVTIMRKIPGMEDSVRAAAAPVDGLSFVNDDGSPIAVMTSSGNADQQSLLSEFEIYRGELGRILVELTAGNERVQYIFGEQVSTMTQRDADDKIMVEFANGRPGATYDLVVACDGATSRTRALGLGCSVRDHIIPIGAWAAYFSIEEDILKASRIGQAISVPGGIFIAAGLDTYGKNRVTVIKVYTNPEDNALDKFREAQKQGMEQAKAFVASHLDGTRWKVKEILNGMSTSTDFYASEICQVKVPKLHQGRFVLVGDAGHATGPTGTGTSLAMTSAYILAGEILRHGSDIEAGLQSYEERMQPIIKDMQVMPGGAMTFMAPQTAWGIWLRNIVFRVVCFGMRFAPVFSWLGSWGAAFKQDQYNIPDYDWPH